MDIRVLLPPPWPMLSPLVAESVEEGLRFLGRLQPEYASGQARFDAEGETFLGAFADAALIGVGGLTRDVYGAEPHTGRLRHLYVRRDWRRRGIGRVLVAELELRARAHFTALVLRTDTTAAAQFYRALGYEQIAVPSTATHRRALVRAAN
jgi:GNAT superfamily N-acetyltransferase